MSNDNREPEDAVFAVGRVDGDVAVAKGLAGDDVLLKNVKVNERWAGSGVVAAAGIAAGAGGG